MPVQIQQWRKASRSCMLHSDLVGQESRRHVARTDDIQLQRQQSACCVRRNDGVDGLSGTRSVRARISRLYVTRTGMYDGTTHGDPRREDAAGTRRGNVEQHQRAHKRVLTGLCPRGTNIHQLFDLGRVPQSDIEQARGPRLFLQPCVRCVHCLSGEEEGMRRYQSGSEVSDEEWRTDCARQT